MDLTVPEQLAVMAIGREVLSHLDPQNLVREAQSEAINLLEEIKQILDDGSLKDQERFQRIEAVVTAFQRYGIPTARHDFG